MLRNEYYELHKILKERIKGRIFIGAKKNDITINIVGFKGITWKWTIDNIDNVEEIANLIERIKKGYC